MTPEEWAEFVWLHGDAALREYVSAAFHPGLGTQNPARSIAGKSAAMLVNARGGDVLERAEFARLFAIGEPQKGLRAFLARRKGMPVAEKG